MTTVEEPARGRQAEQPTDVPVRGWKDVVVRVKDEMKDDHVALLSAGVAFYAMLAIFPALIATVTIYGLVTSPEQVSEQLRTLTEALPESAGQLIVDQLRDAVDQGRSTLGWGLAASLLGVLWATSSGVGGLVKGVNAAYDEDDERGFVKRRALALLLTLGGVVFVGIAAFLTTGVRPLLDAAGLPSAAVTGLSIARWVVLALLVMVALGVVYRVAADRDEPQWRWVSPGSILAAVLWVAASVGFSIYVRNFGNYDETYGAIAGVIVLMLWLFLGAFAVLLGAEVNAEAERQTRRDTTQGEPRPIGDRDAYAADTLGETSE